MDMKIIKAVIEKNEVLLFTIFSILGFITIIILSKNYNLYMYQFLYAVLAFYFVLKSIYYRMFGVYNDWFSCSYF